MESPLFFGRGVERVAEFLPAADISALRLLSSNAAASPLYALGKRALLSRVKAKKPQQRLDELELLFGGLIMVANGFPTKYVEQIEYRIEHPQVYAFEPLADVAEADAPEDDSPRPPPAAAAAADVVVEAAPPPPAADDDDDDDDQVDHLKKRLLRDGQSTYVDKLSGFSFDMASYAVGPDDEGAEPLESKLKRDIILALRAMDWLPAGFKKVIKYLREHGWTKDEAPDAVFNAAATQLFEAGKVQLSFRRDGSPFEVW